MDITKYLVQIYTERQVQFHLLKYWAITSFQNHFPGLQSPFLPHTTYSMQTHCKQILASQQNHKQVLCLTIHSNQHLLSLLVFKADKNYFLSAQTKLNINFQTTKQFPLEDKQINKPYTTHFSFRFLFFSILIQLLDFEPRLLDFLLNRCHFIIYSTPLLLNSVKIPKGERKKN